MRNSKRKLPKSIVWAIDPYETKSAQRAPLAKFLQTFRRGLSEDILPFSVVSPIGLTWPIPVENTSDMDLKRFGVLAVKEDLKKLHLSHVAEPTVEVHESTSRRELVNDVLRFSRAKNAEFIAVNTRRLLSAFPFKIGGFAEALISKSRLPVIAVSPKAKIPKRIKVILFPTDFSPRSHRAFRKTIALAARLKARVHILHLELPIAAPYSFGDIPAAFDGGWFVKAEKLQLDAHKRTAVRWSNEASRAGVRSTNQVVLDPVSLPKAILQGARRHKADLISLASYRSSKAPALIGGTIRDVLSTARTPVLEIHAA